MYTIAIQQNEPNADLIDYLRSQNFTVILVSEDELIEGSISGAYDMAITEQAPLIESIREYNPKVGVIYLSRMSTYVDADMAQGFQAGADMSIARPYSLRYMLACIKAILKRSGKQVVPDNYVINDYTFVPSKRLLVIGDFQQKLTIKEAEILKLLCAYRGSVLPKELVLKVIWKDTNYFNARSLDTHVAYLRRKLSLDKHIKIESITGKGYILVTE